MSDAISSSGDIPENEINDKNTPSSSESDNSVDSNQINNNNNNDSSENSNSNNANDTENTDSQQESSNPFGKISSSDDKDNEAETEDDGFFPAQKFKFKSTRSFHDYASSFSDSTATISQSNGGMFGATSGGSGGSRNWGESSISFVSLDKKNIGQIKLPENIRKLEEAKAKASTTLAATSSDNISSSSDTKQSSNVKDTSGNVPHGNGSSSTANSTNSTSSNFVLFGQNFNDRVSSQADGFKSSSDLISFSDISNSEEKLQKTDITGSSSFNDDCSESKINSTKDEKVTASGSSTNYFTACAEGEGFGGGGFFDQREPESEESDAVKGLKRPFEVISGEEGEETIMSVPGTLYFFDSDKWVGRGRGVLKLNDSKEDGDNGYSRLIVRSLGVHKVLLNARLVRGMNVSLPNETSIRFSTVEGLHHFKSKKKLDDLLELINCRIDNISKKRRDEESSEAEAV